MSKESFLSSLEKIVGKDNILSAEIDRVAYSFSAYNIWSKPDFVIRPAYPEEVADILVECSKNGIPIVPRGNGTSLVGGPISSSGAIMSMRRMNSVLEVNPDDMTATVEAGVCLRELLKELPEDLFFPVDPDGLCLSTFGGMVAENSASPLSLFYGTVGESIMGLEVVTADGSIWELGATIPCEGKMEKLFIGTEGTLGVITKVKVRLRRRPLRLFGLTVDFSHVGDALDLYSRLSYRGELMLGYTIYYRDIFEVHLPDERLGARAYTIIPHEPHSLVEFIKELSEELEILQVDVLELDPRILPYWKGNTYLMENLKTTGKTVNFVSFTTNSDLLHEAVSRIDHVGARMKLNTVTIINPGLNWILTGFSYDSLGNKSRERAHKAVEMLAQSLEELGASFGYGTGVGFHMSCLKFKELDNEALYKKIKKVLDPSGIMNPGKVVLGD